MIEKCDTCAHGCERDSFIPHCKYCKEIGGAQDNYSPMKLQTTGHEMSAERSKSNAT